MMAMNTSNPVRDALDICAVIGSMVLMDYELSA
jgi:hypothetical protein